MSKRFGNGIDLQNQRIINVGSPSTGTDAANRNYVDNLVAGLKWKPSVRLASTGNVSVSAPGTTLDGVTFAVNDRVLLKNQTTASENGVYVWSASASALTRAADGVQGTLVASSTWFIEEGTVNGDTAWTLTTNNPITVGTTALVIVRFGAGTTYVAGNGIDLTSSIITVVPTTGITVTGAGVGLDLSVAVRKFSANIGDGSTTTLVVTHNLGTKDVTYSLRQVSDDTFVDTDVVSTSATQITFAFATAPAANSLRLVVHG